MAKEEIKLFTPRPSLIHHLKPPGAATRSSIQEEHKLKLCNLLHPPDPSGAHELTFSQQLHNNVSDSNSPAESQIQDGVEPEKNKQKIAPEIKRIEAK